MAIHKKFEVTIAVNGVDLIEYDNSDDMDDDNEIHQNKAPVIKKYIEAQPAQNFEIKTALTKNYKFPRRADCIHFVVLFDGQQVMGDLCTKEDYRPQDGWTNSTAGLGSGQEDTWVTHKFMFSELEISKVAQDCVSGKFQELKKKFGSKGTIQVEVWPYVGRLTSEQIIASVSLREEATPEKALKGRAITMAARLGSPEPTEPIAVWSGENIGANPLVTFVFEYRDIKSLKDLRIIPKTPEPVALEDRDPAEMTPAELLELVQRQKALIATRELAIKEEEKPRVKRERSPADNNDEIQEIRTAKVVKVAADIIDLDSD